jgi:hypothetical protein
VDVAWLSFWVDLIGAVATVVALGIAILVGRHEAQRFRDEARERDQDRRREALARERSQAECISARLHVEPNALDILSMVPGSTVPRRHAAYVEIFNASALPIYDVEVLVPYAAGSNLAARATSEFVPGGVTGHVHSPPMADAQLNNISLEVRFRDAGSRSWHRLADGDLHRADECPGPEPVGDELDLATGH